MKPHKTALSSIVMLAGTLLSQQGGNWYTNLEAESTTPLPPNMGVAEINERFSASKALESTIPIPVEGSLEFELDRLANLPRFKLDLATDSPLPTAIRALADAAGMQYFNIPDAQARHIVVNFTVQDNPFTILRELAQMYGFEMRFDRGIWRFGFVDTSIQIAKSYQLSHYTYDRVMGAYGPRIIDVTNPFDASRQMREEAQNEFVSTVRNLLQGDSDVYVTDEMGRDPMTRQRPFFTQRPNTDNIGAPAQVTFDEDSRQLFVKATHSEQQLLQEFLQAVDTPADLIEVEIKFLETEIDPNSAFGMDWSGTFDGGYGAGVAGLTSDLGQWSFPNTILSADDVRVRMQAFAKDKDSRMVQYPRTVTLSNREVVFDAVQQVPYLADQVKETEAVYSETARTEFLEIGTRVRVKPIVQNDDSIYLDMQIEVSDLSDVVVLNGSPVPQTSTRRFSQSVILDDNYTLATGGLERSITETEDKKIPILGNIPFFGFAFKSRTERELRTNLIMLVTVRRVDQRGGGINDAPRHIVRSQGEKELRRVFQGSPSESIEELISSLTTFAADVDIVVQSFREGRNRPADDQMLKMLVNEADLMLVRIEELKILQAVNEQSAAMVLRRIQEQKDRLVEAKSL